MGIDMYLQWREQTPSEHGRQITGFSLEAGDVGYLREAYHGGPYATQLLAPECWASEDATAQITAALMRERLTQVVEASAKAREEFARSGRFITMIMGGSPETQPMSVFAAIEKRYTGDRETITTVKRSFQAFVDLAATKEMMLGEPCTVLASY